MYDTSLLAGADAHLGNCVGARLTKLHLGVRTGVPRIGSRSGPRLGGSAAGEVLRHGVRDDVAQVLFVGLAAGFTCMWLDYNRRALTTFLFQYSGSYASHLGLWY